MERMLVIAALALCACSGESVEGEWQSTDTVVGQRNLLSAEASGAARATIFIDMMSDGQRVAGRFEFEATWIEDSSRSDFEMDCTRTPFGTCEADDDFVMTCRLDEEGATLDCDGSGRRWSEYQFGWSRQ